MKATRKQLIKAAMLYAKQYIGSEAAKTKEADELVWTAEYINQMDNFMSELHKYPLLIVEIKPMVDKIPKTTFIPSGIKEGDEV